MTRILIIGHGIAGALLAQTLYTLGAEVDVLDNGMPGASRVAAGIINPITGKRYVKSWRFEVFFQEAAAQYRTLESRFGLRFFYEMPIYRVLNSKEAENEWSARSGQEAYQSLMNLSQEAGPWSPFVQHPGLWGLCGQSARIDFPALLHASADFWAQRGRFVRQHLNPEHLPSGYDFYLFCEGQMAATNPYFQHLPWQLSKGELLLIQIPSAKVAPKAMLKDGIMLVPIGENLYWAGSNYVWDTLNDVPGDAGLAEIKAALARMLAVPWEVVGQAAAVRPTVRDRRPFIGLHPAHPKIGILNGLGTKAALLAPYWAKHFARHLLLKEPLDPEVDIRRFGQGVS